MRRSSSALNPVSSWSSRSAFAEGGDPTSAYPPGSAQRPLSARLMRTTRPRSSNAATEHPTFGLAMPTSARYGPARTAAWALAYYADLSALSGTLLNALTVLVGGLLGTVLGDRLAERLR